MKSCTAGQRGPGLLCKAWAGTITCLLLVIVWPGHSPQVEAAPRDRNGRIVFEAASPFAREAGVGIDGDLFTVAPNGAGLRQLTEGIDDDFSPAWSPDGTRIAFSRAIGNRLADIYVMSADGRIENLTPDTPLLRDAAPSWSPDGTQIVFVRGDFEGFGDFDLYVMDADGSNLRRLTEMGSFTSSPAWSPDGPWIAYSTDNSNAINLISVDGRVRPSIQPPGGLRSAPTRIRWSPDGQTLSFSMTTTRDVLGGEQFFQSDIWVMGVDGRNLRNLTDDAIGASADDANGSWAPNGKEIVFVSNREGRYYLYKMNSDGSHVMRVVAIEVSGITTGPHWGPRS